MMRNLESLAYVPAEAFLSAFFLLALVLSFWKRIRTNRSLFYLVGFFGITIALTLELTVGRVKGNGALLFYGMIRNDHLSQLFTVLCLFSSLFLLLFSFISRETTRKFKDGAEYVLLILANALGMVLLVSSANLLMMYLSLEFLSFTSYLLTGFVDRGEKTSEAAVKYLLYGGIASGVMVYGLSLLYGIAGSLDYAALHTFFVNSTVPGVTLAIPIIFILAGMGFKIAAFPFHAWCPDVYEGAPTPFTAFLSVGPKAAGFVLIVRFFYQIFGATDGGELLTTVGGLDWSLLFAVLSACTMTFGNLAALHQKNIKRMLAYSSIAHAGYILMAVASQTTFGVSAVFFYFVVYFLMNFGAFLVVILVSNEFNSELIEDYEGLAWKRGKGAFLASMLAVYLLSLTGIPPFAGFIGKVYLLLAVFQKGSSLYWLAVVAVINTVISLYYYARVLQLMFLSKRQKGVALSAMERHHVVPYSVLAGLSFFTVLFGIYWVPIDHLSRLAVNFLK